MIDWLNTIDTQVFLALNGLHAPYFDAFMKLFTGKWIWVPMYAAVLFAVVRNYRWRQADACSAGVRCVGDYDSRPSVCHADTSGSVPAAPLQSRESIVGDGAYCRGLSRRFLRLPIVSRSQFVRSCLIFDIAVCQPQTQPFHFCVGGA